MSPYRGTASVRIIARHDKIRDGAFAIAIPNTTKGDTATTRHIAADSSNILPFS